MLLADVEGKRAMRVLKQFVGDRMRNTNALVFPSNLNTPLRETNVLHAVLHPVLDALKMRVPGKRGYGMHTFRHGCNRRWELAGINAAVLRQQIGHSAANMTALYTGEIPLDQVRLAVSRAA